MIEYSQQKCGFSNEKTKEVFKELPLKLRCEVAMAMYNGVIKSITLFQNRDPNFIVDAIVLLRPSQLRAAESLWREAEPPSEVYFVKKGKINFKMKSVVF